MSHHDDTTRQISSRINHAFAPGPWPVPEGEPGPLDYALYSILEADGILEIGKIVGIPQDYPHLQGSEWLGRDYIYWAEGQEWPDVFICRASSSTELPSQNYESFTAGGFDDVDPNATMSGTVYAVEAPSGNDWVLIGYIDRREEGIHWFADQGSLEERYLPAPAAGLRFRRLEGSVPDVTGLMQVWTETTGSGGLA